MHTSRVATFGEHIMKTIIIFLKKQLKKLSLISETARLPSNRIVISINKGKPVHIRQDDGR